MFCIFIITARIKISFFIFSNNDLITFPSILTVAFTISSSANSMLAFPVRKYFSASVNVLRRKKTQCFEINVFHFSNCMPLIIFYIPVQQCLSIISCNWKMMLLHAGRYHQYYKGRRNEMIDVSGPLTSEYILYNKWNSYHLLHEIQQSQKDHHILPILQNQLHEFFFLDGSLHQFHGYKRILEGAVKPSNLDFNNNFFSRLPSARKGQSANVKECIRIS